MIVTNKYIHIYTNYLIYLVAREGEQMLKNEEETKK